MSDETLREKYDRLEQACDEEEKHADRYYPRDIFDICQELLDLLRPIACETPQWTEGKPEQILIGMVIRQAEGTEWLIGEVNGSGGTCDCCFADELEDAVAWRWVSPEYAPTADKPA